VLGILPGIIGLIQATEAIKLIIGKGTPLIGRLLRFDALEMKFQELKLRKDPNCPICGENPTITELIDYNEFCGIRPAPEIEGDTAVEITPEELKERLERDDVVLVDVREPHEWDICHIEGAKLIPLSEFTRRINELDSASEIVLYCHHGQRSMRALRFLEKAGFRKLWNLKGGIDAWALSVDPDMPRY
jgi:adenylyltransferase/sulfurtransferase